MKKTNKNSKIWIVGTKTEAIKFAKQGLKLIDKTLRLKNVRVIDTTFPYANHKNKTVGVVLAVKVVADTNMKNNAVMVVGYSKNHQNVFPRNFSESALPKGKPSKGVGPLKSTEGQYPKIDGTRKIYVRTPVKVTREMQAQRPWPYNIALGSWIAVDVLTTGGYQHLITPAPCKTEAICQHACDVTNKFHGFSKNQVKKILQASFLNNSIKKEVKTTITKDGIYAIRYDSGLCLVKANGEQKRLSVFSGLCIYDSSKFQQLGKIAHNWDLSAFALIPSIKFKL